ncbi:hypothetical protein LSAT2_020147 [Lamellibrachia satsuma]|nr:hypothetical protein LSAT2_020147 [Lamellibrachia satsuma]
MKVKLTHGEADERPKRFLMILTDNRTLPNMTGLTCRYNGIRGEALLQAARCIVGSIARGEPTARLRKLSLSGNWMGTVHRQVALEFCRFVDDLEGSDLDHTGAMADHMALM